MISTWNTGGRYHALRRNRKSRFSVVGGVIRIFIVPR
jgi:hypothetical protein